MDITETTLIILVRFVGLNVLLVILNRNAKLAILDTNY